MSKKIFEHSVEFESITAPYWKSRLCNKLKKYYISQTILDPLLICIIWCIILDWIVTFHHPGLQWLKEPV